MATQQLHPRKRHGVKRALLTSTADRAETRLRLPILLISWNTRGPDAFLFVVTVYDLTLGGICMWIRLYLSRRYTSGEKYICNYHSGNREKRNTIRDPLPGYIRELFCLLFWLVPFCSWWLIVGDVTFLAIGFYIPKFKASV